MNRIYEVNGVLGKASILLILWAPGICPFRPLPAVGDISLVASAIEEKLFEGEDENLEKISLIYGEDFAKIRPVYRPQSGYRESQIGISIYELDV